MMVLSKRDMRSSLLLKRRSLAPCTWHDSLPSEANWNPRYELPWWLVSFSLVRTQALCSQVDASHPPGAFWAQNQESSVSQQASGFLGVVIDSTQMWAWLSLESSQRTLGLMASPVIPLGLLHMWSLQYWLKACVLPHAWGLGHFCLKVDHQCVSAVAPYKGPHLYQTGVQLGLTSRRNVVKTSISGWGALCEGSPAFGSWSSLEQRLHCLEMMTVF